MEKVTGIGGLFFRARDPRALSRWYEQHLGVTLEPGDYNTLPWRQEAGPTVFAPFPQHTDYFGRAEQAWMVNFRVRDLEAMAAQLRAIASLLILIFNPAGGTARSRYGVLPDGNTLSLTQMG